jgi:hypothetical protein
VRIGEIFLIKIDKYIIEEQSKHNMMREEIFLK